MDDVWCEIDSMGVDLLYSEETESGTIIFAKTPSPTLILQLQLLASIHEIVPCRLGGIDWQDQWRLHGADYRDGFVHLSHPSFQKEILLEPGPGFGDFSHPTTRLVMEMMEQHIKGRHVLDVGCGSGVLSFCALAFGARSVAGIDIDAAALEHAKKNGFCNKMDAQIVFCEPQEYCPNGKSEFVMLMNMIYSEQVVAWESLRKIHPLVRDCFISGVLATEREIYLQITHRWGWTLKSEQSQEDWLGLHFCR